MKLKKAIYFCQAAGQIIGIGALTVAVSSLIEPSASVVQACNLYTCSAPALQQGLCAVNNCSAPASKVSTSPVTSSTSLLGDNEPYLVK